MAPRVAAAPARSISAVEAAGFVTSGMWLDYGAVLAQPDAFDKALARAHRRASRREDPRLPVDAARAPCSRPTPRASTSSGSTGTSPATTASKHDAGRCNYMPVNLGEIPDYYRRFIDPVDIVVLKTCPMDADGYFNFGAANLWHRRGDRARPDGDRRGRPTACPMCCGIDERRPRQRGRLRHRGRPPAARRAAATRRRPRPTAPSHADRRRDRGRRLPADRHRRHAERGLLLLAESGVRDLGIHTEMLTDGIIDLYRAGVVTGARKTLDPGKLVCTFALGSRRLYDAIARNPDIHCCPVDYTNLPHIIMQNDRAVAINNTTQIDLQGQAASESDGHRHISGTGGQAAVRARRLCLEGRQVLHLPRLDLRQARRARAAGSSRASRRATSSPPRART